MIHEAHHFHFISKLKKTHLFVKSNKKQWKKTSQSTK
jgi:hypothetical protein